MKKNPKDIMNEFIFNIYKLKGVNCKILKKSLKNISFQRKKWRNTLEINSPLLQSFSIIEEKIEKYIGDGLSKKTWSESSHIGQSQS